MADVAVLVACVATAIIAPFYNRHQEYNRSGIFMDGVLFRVMLYISLSLFSLLAIEATPKSWRIFHVSFLRELMLGLLWSDSIIITMLVPASIGLNVVRQVTNNRKNGNRLKVIASAICIFVAYTFFCSFDKLVSLRSIESPNLLQRLVSRICAFGLSISSVLNGFGSVSMPHSFLVGNFYEQISQKQISVAEQELQNIESLLEIKRSNSLEDSPTRNSSNGSNKWGEATLIHRCVRSKADMANTPILTTTSSAFLNHNKELATIAELYEDLERELEEMKCVAKAAEASRSSLGKGFRFLGFAFSILLIFRLSFAILVTIRWQNYYGRNLIYGSSPVKADPITHSLLWLAGHDLLNVEQFHALSQASCLILTLCLSYSQVGNFLQIATELSRRLNKCRSRIHHRKANDNEKVHTPAATFSGYVSSGFISIVMGSYFLSCVVVIGTNLPAEFRAPLIYALQGATFSFNPWYTDLLYSLSASIAFLTLVSITGIRQQNSKKRRMLDDFAFANTELIC